MGHENYYFTDPRHPLVCGGSAGLTGGRPDKVRQTVAAQADVIAIPHHTNAVAETRRQDDDTPYWYPYPWTDPTPAHRLVEIIQARGNQECNEYDDPWMGWYQHNGASVQDALQLGYRVGFTGGTDNHCGWPGRAFAETEHIGNLTPWTQIVTGAWTAALARQPVWDALFARRTWAAVNTRALVWFEINGAPCGADLAVAAGTALRARIRLSASAPLKSVEIVSEGKRVWGASFADLDVDVTVDVGRAEVATHFYLRALQRDGGLIYASPVFVDVEE
jgi:hypothetical protein